MAYQFIPVSAEAVAELTDKIGHIVPGFTVEQFINLYNQKIIAQNGPGIKEIVAEILASYKNVKDTGGQLTLTSSNEVFLAEILRNLEVWPHLVVLQREVERLVSEGELAKDDDVYLLVKGQHGFIFSADENLAEGYDYAKLDTEQLWKQAPVNKLVGEFFDHNASGDSYQLPVAHILGLKTDWISEVHSLVPEA